MDWSHYRFLSIWKVPAGPAAVYAVLENAEDYPRWWPQVREAARVDEHSGTARFRSLLPYDLVVGVHEGRGDPDAGLLEVRMTGDLEGWVRWTLRPHGVGTVVRYEQEVRVNKPLLRRLAVPGRPVFLANHALMMRAGRRGLAAEAAGRKDRTDAV
ncbi:SRPBCC family protein [Streptomyces sp. NBC_00237]|uniref:SRPBCC family protein n=1 Tax=Streptomyces sp. NBC_00237 TaxID=2975687 RepID=UPI0022542E6F|nr:SRPBCC family protein [Streptomyces sp. NBC_00237]MCX5202521.1 SRPBCC family protein [Streptomyces sp. NBC_00237]